ncbi:PepSY-like domain-containing protein [Flammeovirgaceae bacterium SG7u.111]|nr:PepSY-like domain-containing protein [Flammeovirgaceae bacterium SG7u.132]WPO33375.1 PepSY-like domain-containing protein [Flammeovirgaceae bacterium SG7u.111]
MKQMTSLMLGVLMALSQIHAQSSTEVPEKVKTAFSQKFPNATNVEWEKENETEWEAEFKMDGKEYSSNFTSQGVWTETEYEIKKLELSTLAKKTLNTEFAGYEIKEAEISETAEGKVYEIELKKGEQELQVVISTNGKLIKKVVEDDDK